MITQISIYTENKRGAARQILSLLSEKDINVLGFVSSESGDFGTLRLIVSDPDGAMTILEDGGYLCRRGEVLGVELPDQPGQLAMLLQRIEEININIDYMYVGYRRENHQPVILLHCDDQDIVAGILTRSGYTIY